MRKRIRLFGDVLPFIGFRTVPMDTLCEQHIDNLHEIGADAYEMFTVEWLGHGFYLFGRPVWTDLV